MPTLGPVLTVPATVSASSPALLGIGQARTVSVVDAVSTPLVVTTLRLPDVYSSAPSTFTLYRASSFAGTYTQVDQRTISPTSRWISLFDSSPNFGSQAFYYATIDGGVQTTNALAFTAVATPSALTTATSISPGALGPYPLLGSDVYLDPVNGDGVIGPNGDLLTINGLPLLAQDLRTRFLTTQGELLLHPDFGMQRSPRLIGSGQNDPTSQALYLETLVIAAFTADPRVDSVPDIVVARTAVDAWTLSANVIAIGVEDPQLLNLVFPYYIAS